MSERNLVQTFSEEMASRLTGVSIRQLRYWDRDGFFSPSFGYEDRRAPYSRLYSFRDLAALRVLNILRNDAGVPLQHLRHVKEKLLSIGDTLWSETLLYVHNKRVAFVNPNSEILEEVLSGQALLHIELKVVSEGLHEAIKRINERKPADIGRLEQRRSVASNQLVIAGTRIPVANVKAFAEAGYSVDKIKSEYPTLTVEDIQAAIKSKAA